MYSKDQYLNCRPRWGLALAVGALAAYWAKVKLVALTCATVILTGMLGVLFAAEAGSRDRTQKNNWAQEVNIYYHLVSDPRIKVFVNTTEKKLVEDFKRLREIGFTHVTLWAGNGLRKDSEEERLMKLAVRKAGDHGLRCYIVFWVGGKPEMMNDPFWKQNAPPFVDKAGKQALYINVWDEKWRAGFLRDYLLWLGKTFSAFPNVEGYVTDEPDGTWWKFREYGYDEGTRKQFVAWLKKKHGTVATLNAAWGSAHQEWDQMQAPREETAKSWPDWTMARQQFFVDWFADTKRYLKEAHPGCTLMQNFLPRYIDNPEEKELADCLDWKRIIPHADAVLMAKFSGKEEDFIRDAKALVEGLNRKPEMKGVGKVLAAIVWRSPWGKGAKITPERPETLTGIAQAAAEAGCGFYIWAWNGPNHLEGSPALQEALKSFYAGRR